MFLLLAFAGDSPTETCSAVLLGSIFTEAAACAALGVMICRDLRGHSPRAGLHTGQRMAKLCLPLAASDYLRSGLRTIEQFLIPWGLMRAGGSYEAAMAEYGMFGGMVFPVLMLPAAFSLRPFRSARARAGTEPRRRKPYAGAAPDTEMPPHGPSLRRRRSRAGCSRLRRGWGRPSTGWIHRVVCCASSRRWCSRSIWMPSSTECSKASANRSPVCAIIRSQWRWMSSCSGHSCLGSASQPTFSALPSRISLQLCTEPPPPARRHRPRTGHPLRRPCAALHRWSRRSRVFRLRPRPMAHSPGPYRTVCRELCRAAPADRHTGALRHSLAPSGAARPLTGQCFSAMMVPR